MRFAAVIRRFTVKAVGVLIAFALALALSIGSAGADVQVIYVPGTGSTTPNPPETTDISWLDNNAYKDLPVDGVTDSDEYPATLGHGGTNPDGSHIATGPESKDMGVAATITHVKGYDQNKTVIVMACGSQGAMVCQEAAAKLVQEGYPADHLYLVEYSNPYKEDTGFIDRFNSNEEAGLPIIWMTGFKGGAPQNPEGPKILQITHEYDPMSYSPRYQWTFLWTVPNAILGFAFQHGDISLINYADPKNEEVTVGNVKTVTLHAQTVPLLMPLVLVAASMGIPPQVSQSLLKPLDDIVRPIVDMGGQKDPGKFTLFPTPEVFMNQLIHVAAGFANAIVDTAKLATGQPVLDYGKQVGPTPTEQLIAEAKAKDAELNGTSSGTGATPTAAVNPTAAVPPQIQNRMALNPSTPPKEDVVQTPQPTVADKNSTEDQGSKDAPAPSLPVTPPADQPKVTNVTPSKSADDDAQHQGSQKDGDQGANVPKNDTKPSQSSDAPKGQKNGDDPTPPKRAPKAPKRVTNNGKKDADATKPETPSDAPAHRPDTSAPSRQATSGNDGDTGHSNSGPSGDGGAKPARTAAHAAN